MNKHILILLVLKICASLVGGGVTAQYFDNEHFCGMEADENELANFTYAEKRFPVEGDVNALFIFVQHRNSFYEDCREFIEFDSDSGLPIVDIHDDEFDYENLCQNRPVYETTNCIEGHTLNRRQDVKYGLQSLTDDPVTEWPANLPFGPDSLHTRHLPCWANDIIDPPQGSQITEGSMTDLYNRVSNGKLNFRGHVWPYTYIPENNWQWYGNNANIQDFPNGMVHLSHEIISYVNDNPHGLDFTTSYWDNYKNGFGEMVVPNDTTADRIFDMIVLVYRFSKLREITTLNGNAIPGSGYASLGTSSLSGDGFERPRPDSAPDTLALGSFRVIDNVRSGSGVISQAHNKLSLLRITAHELGHRHFGPGHTYIRRNTTLQRPVIPVDHFSIMSIPHLSFSALDRIRLGWASILYKQIDEIDPNGYDTVSLRDAHHPNPNNNYDVLWIKQNSDKSLGDVVVEVRLGKTVIEQNTDSDHTHTDGDLDDYFLPNPGFYLYKPDPELDPLNSWSLLNGGYNIPINSWNLRRQFFGVPETDNQGFGETDAYTPFTLINYDLETSHRTNIDLKLAITHFQETYDSFAEFRVWGDFLQANTAKDLTSYYTFEENSIGNTNNWEVGGSFNLLGPVASDNFTFASANGWNGLHLASGDITLSNAGFTDFNTQLGITVHNSAVTQTPVISNSIIETGIHVYGSDTQALLIENSITGGAAGSVYASGGSNIYLNRNDLVGPSSGLGFSINANVHISSATAQFSLPLPTFDQGYNRLVGGEYALYATGATATIYAGTFSSYRFNSFCDENIKIRAVDNATILASNNYWNARPTEEISSGGSITIGNILGKPNDCTGLFDKNQTDSFRSSAVLGFEDNPNGRYSPDSISDSMSRLYEAIDFRTRSRFSEAYYLVEEIIQEEELPYFGVAVKELLLLAPHIERELVLSILNSYYEDTELELTPIIYTNLALYHARSGDFDLSLSMLEQLERYNLNDSERFYTQLQQFYIAMDAGYTDTATTTLSGMVPTNELEDWEKQVAINVMERSTLNENRPSGIRVVNNRENTPRGAPEVEGLNYPNPFNPSTTIQYSLTEPGFITLEVYDILGQRVALLVNSNQDAGTHRALFDATRMATGMYLYRLSVNGTPAITNTMLLIK